MYSIYIIITIRIFVKYFPHQNEKHKCVPMYALTVVTCCDWLSSVSSYFQGEPGEKGAKVSERRAHFSVTWLWSCSSSHTHWRNRCEWHMGYKLFSQFVIMVPHQERFFSFQWIQVCMFNSSINNDTSSSPGQCRLWLSGHEGRARARRSSWSPRPSRTHNWVCNLQRRLISYQCRWAQRTRWSTRCSLPPGTTRGWRRAS